MCAREITAVDGIEEETGEGSVAMTGCPPQWLLAGLKRIPDGRVLFFFDDSPNTNY